MSSDKWLDNVAQTLARARSRRDVLRGLATAVGLALYGGFGSSAHAQGGRGCADYCRSLELTGRELGDCIADCARGGIPCGSALCDAETEFCCNESCSICVPIGGTCTQQFCP